MNIEIETLLSQQQEARRRFAGHAQEPEARWVFISDPVPGFWYDFLDVATGRYGQCCMGEAGRWKQPPLGERPTLLEYQGRKRAH